MHILMAYRSNLNNRKLAKNQAEIKRYLIQKEVSNEEKNTVSC